MGVLSRVFGCWVSSSKKKNKKGKTTKVSPDEKSGPRYEDEVSVDALAEQQNNQLQRPSSTTLVASTDQEGDADIEVVPTEEDDVLMEMSIHVDDMTAGTARDPSLGFGFQYHPSQADRPPPTDLPTSVRGGFHSPIPDDVSQISLDPGLHSCRDLNCRSPTSTIASRDQLSSYRRGGGGGGTVASVTSMASGSVVIHDKHEEDQEETVEVYLPIEEEPAGEDIADTDDFASTCQSEQDIPPFDDPEGDHAAAQVANHIQATPRGSLKEDQEEENNSNYLMHHDYHNNSDYYIPQHLLKQQQQQEGLLQRQGSDEVPQQPMMSHVGRSASTDSSSVSYASSTPRSTKNKQRNSLLKYQQRACAKAAQLKQQLVNKATGNASVSSNSHNKNNNSNKKEKSSGAGSLIRQIRYIHAGDEDNSVSVVSV